ncbi:DUF1659 domain-containing protein [Halobacillus rhizosphaerae]|uniref:DUF1659 domain-containing protein n=1 Tax=Halobacillus rhizosphaerae TaxID=3064889 RepID=UPI00398BA2B4
MAVTADKVNSQLQLVFATGQDEEGKTTFRTKSFNNIKLTSTPDQLYRVASVLEPLQQHLLATVERNDRTELADL